MEHKKVKDGYVIRLDKGEKLIASLISFAEKENIKGAFFYGVGALKNTRIGYAGGKEKGTYVFLDFPEEKELVSLNGSISLKEGKPLIHAHGVLGDWNSEMRTIGGHIKEGEIAITAEIFMHLVDTEMTRKFDEDTGLYLLSF